MPWPLPAPHPPPSDRHRRRRAQSRKPSSRRANKEPPRRSDGSRSTSVERALPWPLGHISALRNQDITKKNCILEYFTYLICVLSGACLSYLPLRGEVDARSAAGGAASTNSVSIVNHRAPHPSSRRCAPPTSPRRGKKWLTLQPIAA